MITHIIDQFILNPSSFFWIPVHFDQFISDPLSQNKVKAEKLGKFAQKLKF